MGHLVSLVVRRDAYGLLIGGVDSSLASAGNELKLQATGSGLDDLEEEFMDGR
jgi:hypothetical protein